MANDTPWGLAGYLFTQDVDRGFRGGRPSKSAWSA
jgi:succinate-semialdehyde dehydrogenase/glutarate-semialdehyde dehydrogenase